MAAAGAQGGFDGTDERDDSEGAFQHGQGAAVAEGKVGLAAAGISFVVGAALGVAALGSAGAVGSEYSRSLRGRLPYRVIVDQRFQEARAFGHGAAQLGCTIQPITGDVTSLWFNELQPLWARGEGEIVGMTTGASLMCLEQLAWNQWMRVVARVDHRAESDGTGPCSRAPIGRS